MNESVSEKVKKIIKSEIRKGEMGKISEILHASDALFNHVYIDLPEIQKKMISVIKESSEKNPLNTVFKLFGLTLVKSNSLEIRIRKDKAMENELRKYLTIDEKGMEKAISNIALIMKNYEQEQINGKMELTKTVNSNLREIEKIKTELQNQMNDFSTKERELAIGLQELMSLKTCSLDMQQEIEDILHDVGLSVNWHPNGKNDSDFYYQIGISEERKKQFNGKVYEEMYISKPAIKKKDELIVKGYFYVIEEN